MTSWEQMAVQVIVLGRPGDVRSAALDWDQVLKAADEAVADLDKHVTDLGNVWKGPAYESFKTHVKAITKQLRDLNANARQDDGIVTALNNAAGKLEKAQQDMPIPASCTADLIAARNMQMSIPVGFFTMKLREGFLHGIADNFLASAEYKLMDWINDQSGTAANVYHQVDGEYRDQTYRTPGSTDPTDKYGNRNGIPAPGPGPGAGPMPGAGGLPGGGGIPKQTSFDPPHPGLGNVPDTGASSGMPGTGDMPGIGGMPGGGAEGSGAFDPTTGSGLAGAGGGLTGAGLGGGFGGGLGGAGLGTGAGGLGAGGLPGGGALGKGVAPSMGGMMGAGGGPGGRSGGGRGASSRSGRGAMTGGHGGGHGDSDDERTTWLEEDEDPWGSNTDGPPAVLK